MTAPNPKNTKKIEQLQSAARSLVLKERFEKAVSYYHKLIELDPDEGEWMRRASDCYWRLENEAKRKELASQAATAYAYGGHPLKAIAMAKVVLSIDPKHRPSQKLIDQLCGPSGGQEKVPAGSPITEAGRSPKTPRDRGAKARARMAAANALRQIRARRAAQEAELLRDEESKAGSVPAPSVRAVSLEAQPHEEAARAPSYRAPATSAPSVPMPSAGTPTEMSPAEMRPAEMRPAEDGLAFTSPAVVAPAGSSSTSRELPNTAASVNQTLPTSDEAAAQPRQAPGRLPAPVVVEPSGKNEPRVFVGGAPSPVPSLVTPGRPQSIEPISLRLPADPIEAPSLESQPTSAISLGPTIPAAHSLIPLAPSLPPALADLISSIPPARRSRPPLTSLTLASRIPSARLPSGAPNQGGIYALSVSHPGLKDLIPRPLDQLGSVAAVQRKLSSHHVMPTMTEPHLFEIDEANSTSALELAETSIHPPDALDPVSLAVPPVADVPPTSISPTAPPLAAEPNKTSEQIDTPEGEPQNTEDRGGSFTNARDAETSTDTLDTETVGEEYRSGAESVSKAEPVAEQASSSQMGEVSPTSAGAFANIPLLSHLSDDALRHLISQVDLIELLPNQILFRQGDTADSMFVLVEGEIAITIHEGEKQVELGNVVEGEFFGEIGLLSDQPRQATAVAAEPCRLLRFDRNAVGELIDNDPQALTILIQFLRERLVDDLMLTSPLFEPFAESERKALIERFEFLEIEQASLLIKKGRAPGGFYVLLSGEVLADQQGRLRRLGPGATFGGPDLLQGRPSKTDVLASKKCFALFLSEKVFRELIMTHPMVLEVISNQPDPAAGVPDVWNHHLTLF